MPWKGEKNPYKIWLSEIILQQTRVEQGVSYYNSLIKKYPTIHKLARADDLEVFKLWEGLGYYSRCKNLLVTARHIAFEKNGIFPQSYNELLLLKGVGAYTAAAISSFAFNLPHAVVDGNVFRVLARVFAVDKAIDSSEGKKFFTALANELLDKNEPAKFNQAIMDFGAVVCKPAAPLCGTCVFKNSCKAFLANKIGHYPLKEKRIKVKKRWFNYLVVVCKQDVLITQRTANDIWEQLYEFPLFETEKKEDDNDLYKKIKQLNVLPKNNNLTIHHTSKEYKQQLTHQQIYARFFKIELTKKSKLTDGCFWVKKTDLQNYAFPKIIKDFLKAE